MEETALAFGFWRIGTDLTPCAYTLFGFGVWFTGKVRAVFVVVPL